MARLYKYYCFLIFILYFPLIFIGYGADIDTYGMLYYGKQFFETGEYTISRPPGYIIYELWLGLIHYLGGGFITSNFFNLLFSIVIIKQCFNCLNRFNVPQQIQLIVVSILALNPYFIISGTTSMDYQLGLMFFALGANFFQRRIYFRSSFLFMLSIGVRLQYIFTVFPFALYIFLLKVLNKQWLKTLGIALIFLLSIVFYIPSYIQYNHTFGFLVAYVPDWNLFEVLARFIYKNVLLFGLVPFLAISSILVIYFKKIRIVLPILFHQQVFPFVFASIFSQIVYFVYPVEVSYLLSFLYLFTIILGLLLCKVQIKILPIIPILIFISGIIKVDFLKPDKINDAQNATFGLYIEEGILIKNSKETMTIKNGIGKPVYDKVKYKGW